MEQLKALSSLAALLAGFALVRWARQAARRAAAVGGSRCAAAKWYNNEDRCACYGVICGLHTGQVGEAGGQAGRRAAASGSGCS